MNFLSVRNGLLVSYCKPLMNDLLQFFAGNSLFDSCSIRPSSFDIGNKIICEHSWAFNFENKKASKILTFISNNYDLIEEWQCCINLIFN